MTVSSTTSSIIYVGDGLTTEFDVPFRFLEDSDLQLSIQATDGTVTNLVLNSDYTVSGANEDNGGKVYLVNPVGDQAKLSILRVMDLLQETDYRENERFPAESHERALDKLTFEAQQLQAQLDRAIKVDVFSDVDPDVLRQHIERVWDSCDNIDTVADDITNVDTVSSNIANVNTAATNIADINTNADNITDINTNASNITDITTTASHISAVETVSDNITDVSNVSNSIGNVNTVAGSISNVDTVSSNIADVNTVAGISTDVSAVAGISTQVDAVADNKTNIDTVAGISSDVTTVAGISGDVTSVSGISSDVTSVAGNATNINTVAGISSKVSTVAAISSDVTEVAGIRMDVQTVSFNSSAVTTAATNIAAIQAAPTAASNAATSANNASIWAEGTDAQVEALGGVHSSKVWAEVSAEGQIQSDWNQTDNTKKDYIKNKPFIPTQAGDIGAVESNASITGATKCKITYDAKGLVTAGADLEETDIPSLHLAKVTDVTADASELNTLDGITASTTELNYVTGVTSAIQTQIDDRVTLNTAQTISGTKTFSDVVNITRSGDAVLSIKRSDLASNATTPSAIMLEDIPFFANDDSYVGRLVCQQLTTGEYDTILRCTSKVNGTEKNADLRLAILSDGTTYARAPNPPSATDNSDKIATTSWVRNHCCTTAATATSTASKDAPAYVVKNYRSGDNWYRVWSDGWIEQGGAQTNTTGGATSYGVSLLYPFTTANYTVMRAPLWGSGWGQAGADGYTTGILSRTTTYFECATHASSIVAKIMWYACGY